MVTGSVTVYPEDIVSSENSDGWWKLVPPDKKTQPHFKVCVHMKLFLRNAERDPGSADECKGSSRELPRTAEQVAGSDEECRRLGAWVGPGPSARNVPVGVADMSALALLKRMVSWVLVRRHRFKMRY